MKLFTNGSNVHETATQEQNALLEAPLGGALNNFINLTEVTVRRTTSGFHRPFVGESIFVNLFHADPAGFRPASTNSISPGNQSCRRHAV